MDPLAQQPQQSPIQTNSMPVNTPTNTPSENKKVGPIIAILVVVLILIIGAIYLFASRVNQQVPSDTNIADNSLTSSQPETVTPVTNKADDINSIEADLNASTNGLDNQNF